MAVKNKLIVAALLVTSSLFSGKPFTRNQPKGMDIVETELLKKLNANKENFENCAKGCGCLSIMAYHNGCMPTAIIAAGCALLGYKLSLAPEVKD